MIFINNKYTTWYFNLISKAQTRSISGYTEKHHIIPKCLGGDNSSTNLVHLTAREHFVCHRMLTKMVDTSVKHKLVFAAWQQSRPSKHKDVKISSRTYETLRKQLSETYTGRKRAPITEQALANMRAVFKTRRKIILTEQQAAQKSANLSASKKGKLTGKDNPFYGKTHTVETRNAHSQFMKDNNPNKKYNESHKQAVIDLYQQNYTRKQILETLGSFYKPGAIRKIILEFNAAKE
jgi:hypothetical protein